MSGSGRDLLQALDHWVNLQPDKVPYVNSTARRWLTRAPQVLHRFVDDKGVEVETLTYKVC